MFRESAAIGSGLQVWGFVPWAATLRAGGTVQISKDRKSGVSGFPSDLEIARSGIAYILFKKISNQSFNQDEQCSSDDVLKKLSGLIFDLTDRSHELAET